MKVVVVGARTARQGTGPFIAGAFKRSGALVSGVVGTQTATVEQALSALKTEQGIDCNGYSDLRQALLVEQPHIVALCSPYQFHGEQLLAIAEANCHCLVEKPLIWPANDSQVLTVLEAFKERSLLLKMVAQWPQTLRGFTAVHGPLPETISHFSMRLSPISIGENMIPDSAPHFISMLQALAGPGDFNDINIEFQSSAPQKIDGLVLGCNYEHENGTTEAQLKLETCETRPRPAWYQINRLRVDREVQLPDYKQELVSHDKYAVLQDPLESVVDQFLQALINEEIINVSALRKGQSNLQQLADAWPQS